MIQLVHEPLAWLAGVAGLPVDPFKIIACLLLSYPLAALLKRLPDDQPRLKNIFCVATGLFFLVGIFDLWGGIWTLFVSCAGTWLLCKYFKSPFMPWVNFVFIMGHMSIKYEHIVRLHCGKLTPAVKSIVNYMGTMRL